MIVQRVLKSLELHLLLLLDDVLFFNLDFVRFVSELLLDELLTKVVVLCSQFCAFKFQCIYLTNVFSLFLRRNHHGSIQANDLILPEIILIDCLFILQLLYLSSELSVFIIKISVVLVNLELRPFVVYQVLYLLSKSEILILKPKDPLLVLKIA
jgi:hypothetical protein